MHTNRRMFAVSLILGFCIVIGVVSSAAGVDFRRAASFEDAFDASCRVSVSGARGSGTFIGYDGNKAYILTNYHVVTTSNDAVLDFWTNGKRQSIKGKIDWRYYDSNMPADFARIVVDAKELKKIDPPWVALGGSDARPSVNAFIISSGAPDGRFTQSWKGQVVEYYNNKTCVFSPPPVPGQSGSGICEFVDDELFLTGILTWLLGEKGRDDSKGGAIPIENLYVALRKKPAPAAFELNSPIPPEATECAVPRPVGLAFITDNCAACNVVKRDFNRLEVEGVIKVVNVSDPTAKALAREYSVSEFPHVVILIGNEVKGSVSYDEMIAHGTYSVVHRKLDELDNAQYPDPPKTIDDAEELTEEQVILPTQNEDFRTREPVRESLRDSGFFDKSERIWRGRGNRQIEPDDEIEEYEGDCPEEDVPSQNSGGWYPGERAFNNLAEKLGTKVDSSIRDASNRIAGSVTNGFSSTSDKIADSVSDSIVKASAGFSLEKLWKGIKMSVFILLICAFVIGSLIGQLITSWTKILGAGIKNVMKAAATRVLKETNKKE